MHTCSRHTLVSLKLIEAVHGRSLGKGAVICTHLREINTFSKATVPLKLGRSEIWWVRGGVGEGFTPPPWEEGF